MLDEPGKQPLFSVDERVAMHPRGVRGDMPAVEVDTFDGLLVDYAQRTAARTAIVRGLRERRRLRLRTADGADEPASAVRTSRRSS